MVNHAARDHALWSASSTDRNWNCPGALALTADLPESTNEAADWGTACHQVAEKCLRNGGSAHDLIGTTEKGKKHSFEVDEEMADTAQMYVDYVRGVVEANPGAVLNIEERFSLETLNTPFEAGGTADADIYLPALRQKEVVDLKGGRGVVVEAKGNPQLRTYALGAMLANPGLAVDTVKVTIVQPRAGHKDGRIRSETFHVVDLVEWTTELLAAMRRSAAAEEARKTMPTAAWAAVHLKAGDHCKFCKAAGFCPALEQKALDTAGVWFDDLNQPRLSNAPETLSPERLAQLLDAADMIGDWINAVRAHAHAQAEGGVAIPHYILVDKEGREKWNEGEEAKAAALATSAGVAEDKVFNAPKIRTPKQVRDALRKAKADASVIEAVSALSSTPKTGTNLVRDNKTTRAAVTPGVNKHFDILD